MIYPVKFDRVSAPSHFVIPKTIESDSPEAAIRLAEHKAYGLCARSFKVFPPGTTDLSTVAPLGSCVCDYSSGGN